MLQSIRPFLIKFSSRPGMALKLEEQKIVKTWPSLIKTINKDAQGKSQALYLNKNGELVVQVVNHLWLQELCLCGEEIKQKVSKKYAKVKGVRFVIA